MSPRSETLIIVEGPDGGGKTTLSRQLAKQHGAAYTHLGPFKGVKHIGRLYVEAMLPALLGHQPVVLDRSWWSEPVYGAAFRGGRSRLSPVELRMLDRVALRCRARLVMCLPSVETCLTVFRQRRGQEMLEREEQLRQVHQGYRQTIHDTALDVQVFNYERGPFEPRVELGSVPHSVACRSAGHLAAGLLLVGEGLGPVKEPDPLHQYPFVSFSRAGCSQWLTAQLLDAGVNENQLCWANADDPGLEALLSGDDGLTTVHALGQAAAVRLRELGRPDARAWPHPQHHKRFKSKETYPLTTYLLKEAS